MCAKQLWKNDISSKDVRVTGLNHYLKTLCLHRYFSLFHTFCNQLPDFSVTRALAANGLKPYIFNKNFPKPCQELFADFLSFPCFPGLSESCMHMPYLQHRFHINVLFKKIQFKKRKKEREAISSLINAVFNCLDRYVSFCL